jgi:hypothetical protein
MRRHVALAIVVICLLVAEVPALAAARPAARLHVLLQSKPAGHEVKPGTVLFAPLEKGTSVVFSLGSLKLTCKSSGFVGVVVKNPVAPE